MQRASIVCVLASVSFLLLAATEVPDPATTPLAIDVHVQPSSMDSYMLLKRKTPATYTCTALVSIAGTNKAYAGPRLVVAAGSREEVTVKNELLDVYFSVSVAKDRTSASTKVVVSRGGKTLHQQTSRILLEPRPRA